MHKELLLRSFRKIKKEHPNLSYTKQTEELSNVIDEIGKEVIGGKRISQLLKDAKEKDINLREGIANALSKYLGYANYAAFAINQEKRKTSLVEKIRKFIFKHKITFAVGLFLLGAFWLFLNITKREWMIWETDHYEKIEFQEDFFNSGRLKLYNEQVFTVFKRISPGCNTVFFNEKGEAMVWYGKNENKEYEYYSSEGKHPITGKPLKPITAYMVQKYICNK